MNYIEVDIRKILLELLNSKYIGHGTKAICFKNGLDVIKLYYRHFYNDKEMNYILNNLFNFNNDSFVIPNEILNINDKCIGYKMNYIDAKTLKYINGNIYNLLNNFELLVNDVKMNSDKGLLINDLHYDNILFNGKYYLIDLENYNIGKEYDFIFNNNMYNIVNSILNSIFGIDRCLRFSFYNDKYIKMNDKLIKDYRYFYDIIYSLTKDCDSEDITLIRKRSFNNCIINSYF